MARFKQIDVEEESFKEGLDAVNSRKAADETEADTMKAENESKMTMLREYRNKISAIEKYEFYTGFSQDLDKVGSDLRAELERHLDADKGGDILDDAFLQKILEKYEERLKKLSEDFAEKVKKSLDKELPQIKMPEVSGGSAAGPLVGGAATGILTGLLVATIPVTTTSFFIFATTSTLAAVAGGVIGASAGVVTGGVGAAVGVAVAAKMNRSRKYKIRCKRIDDTIKQFDENIKPKYLDWAKKLLEE